MRSLYLVNILLALCWGAITGSFSLLNLLFGFVLGALALLLIREQIGTAGYFSNLKKVTSLLLLFLYELLMSAVRVMKLAFQRDLSALQPAIFAYPLKVKSDAEITLLANLITLTPGTLSVDVSDNRKTLYIHGIHIPNVQDAIDDIANGFEKKIMEVFK